MAKSPQTKIPADIAKMSFEDALEELESIVNKLERGTAALDESIEVYERGTQLKAHCEAKLAAARAKVEKISLGASGEIGTTKAEIE